MWLQDQRGSIAAENPSWKLHEVTSEVEMKGVELASSGSNFSPEAWSKQAGKAETRQPASSMKPDLHSWQVYRRSPVPACKESHRVPAARQ